jgi:hypothetical protein
VPIIRRNYCTYATLVFALCVGGLWSAGWTPTSRPDATHTEWQIPVSHRYSNFSWWWAHGWPKHVEKRNKYTKHNCAPSWIYLQDCPDQLWCSPSLLPILYWGSFPGAKRLGREVHRLPLSSVEVRNKWSYICSSSVCIRVMDGYNNTFIFLFAVFNKGTLDGSQWTDVRDYKHCVQTVSGGRGGVLTSSV